MSILDLFVAESMDASMSEYLSSEGYQQESDQIEELTKELQKDLTPDQKEKLSRLMDLISSCDGEFALRAYKRGVAEGIAFRQEVLIT